MSAETRGYKKAARDGYVARCTKRASKAGSVGMVGAAKRHAHAYTVSSSATGSDCGATTNCIRTRDGRPSWDACGTKISSLWCFVSPALARGWSGRTGVGTYWERGLCSRQDPREQEGQAEAEVGVL